MSEVFSKNLEDKQIPRSLAEREALLALHVQGTDGQGPRVVDADAVTRAEIGQEVPREGTVRKVKMWEPLSVTL